MTTFVLTAHEAWRYPVTQLGGKAYHLAWLQQHGFPVPAFAVLTTAAGEAFLRHANLSTWIAQQMASLPDHPEAIGKTLEAVRQAILSASLPTEVSDALHHALEQPAFAQAQFFAVRSSVIDEDAQATSFAGQMDSFLFQQGFETIVEAYKKCLASAFSERAYSYRLTKGLTTFSIHSAVVVQTMINGEVSGVLFTAHPVHGYRDQFLLSACYGLGEGIVSGMCNTDEFTLTAEGQEIARQIRQKDCQMVFNQAHGMGTIESSVEPDKQTVPCLRTEHLQALARYGRHISTLQRCPQDIEWTLSGDSIFILQTRPITTLPAPQVPRGKAVVWDNSNIQESYCGVTTPLTFSFASRAYAMVYRQTMRVLNLSEAMIQEHENALGNLLGLIKGRVYYNINNWYTGLLQMPSFRTNKQDMERMMGLQDPVDFIQDRQLTLAQKLAKVPQLLGLLVRFPIIFLRMDALVAAFQQMFAREYSSIVRDDLHRLDISQLMALAEHLHKAVLGQWSTPILNDIFVMMMHGKVRRQLLRVQAPHPDALQNNLLAGETDLESTEPTKWLLRLCDVIRQRPVLQDAWHTYPDQQLMPALKHLDPEFHAQCLAYIERYGDRTMGELKLETITLRHDPSFMFRILRNFLAKPELTAAALGSKEHDLRTAAEAEASRLVLQKQGRLGLWRFHSNVRRLRQAIKHRENMRMARTRLFGLFRDIYSEVGQQLAFYGMLDDPRDVFYLTVEELESYHDGRAVQSFLKPLVTARKAEYAQYEAEDVAHHFVTHGAVYHHNTYQYTGQAAAPAADQAGVLQGIGCYPGVVEAQVKLIFAPDEATDLTGHILCTVRTDPGWAPLFPAVAGLLIERGSTLSHSAVVARELGIPAVVGVPGLTTILKTGDRVRMDGAQGTITRLSKAGTDGQGNA